ncbi:MAG: hypothetical protein LIO90_02515 [Bacteroidales bacterium]|nr:hypothetical protein [Bacteroidales bacterium]
MNLRNIFMLSNLLAVSAMAEETPLITFHTSIYETDGATNTFSLVIGGNNGGYLDIDCGFGPMEVEIEPAIYDSDQEAVTGTIVSCQVSSAGIVNIYGDPGSIDYFNADGCYITSIEFNDPTSLETLSLSHNELEALDLSACTGLRVLYLNDNAFSTKPLIVGPNKPELTLLDLSIVENLDPSFNLSDYPGLMVFDAMSCPTLTQIDPSGCPYLTKLSIDCTNVKTLDVTNNPNLLILNISDTGISEIDLSKSSKLEEFYCTHTSGVYNAGVKISSLDLSNCPNLIYLFAAGNALTELDVTANTKLDHIWLQQNYLTVLDLSNCPNLTSVRLDNNYFTFATLPEDPGTWNEYVYNQRPLPMSTSYLLGTTLDFSQSVLRPDTETYAALFSISESDPNTATEVDASYYTYADGCITINEAISDSVYVAFANSMFTEYELDTPKFKVKNKSEYGQNDIKLSFQPAVDPGTEFGFYIGIDGASEAEPVPFYVDYGNGSLTTFYATTITTPEEPNAVGTQASYGMVKLYVPEGQRVTALKMDGIGLYSIDVTAMPCLRELQISDAGLYTIDLQWNRCLQTLDLSGNNFYILSLEGNNTNYGKNVLSHIDLSNNAIYDLTLPSVEGIEYLDVSHNAITSLDFTDAERLYYLNVSYNELEELKINYCSALLTLDASHNQLTNYTEPETFVMETLIVNDNQFTMATLPARHGIAESNFIYAPQAMISIPSKGPGIDLSAQNVEIDGEPTEFKWYTVDGVKLEADVDYTNEDGKMRFINTEVGEIYCAITNASLPAFSGDNVLRTTNIEAAPMPTNVLATFVTTEDGEEVTLSLASHTTNNAVYIDWNGDGTGLEQYPLATVYTLFTATTKAGAEVKVYSYDEQDNMSVFSMRGATLSSFEAQGLNQLICFSLCGAGLSEIGLPDAPLTELFLEGNALTDIDLSAYPDVAFVSLADNQLHSIDLSKNTMLQNLSVSTNYLSKLDLCDNPRLWAAYASDNNLTEIDFGTVTNLQQLALDHNCFKTIDLSSQEKLLALTLNDNDFTLATLPLPQSQWSIYSYANQAVLECKAVDGVVDLSSQAEVNGTATEYRWFIDYPELNDEGELEGEELYVNDEYTLENGVTYFHGDFTGIVGVLHNSVFSSLYLYTPMLSVTAGIDTVTADGSESLDVALAGNGVTINGASGPIYVYDLAGRLIAFVAQPQASQAISLTSGTYLIVAGQSSAKVLIP